MKFNKSIKFIFSLFLVISLCVAPAASDGKKNEGMIAFNFVDVELSALTRFISEITGKNFLFDERVKGKITIIAPTKLSVEESFRLFTSVLSLKGYTIVPTGQDTYKIVPSSLAKQMGIITTDDEIPVNEGYITKLIPVEHVTADETIQFIRPIISRDGHISAFDPRNLLLIVDSAVNIEKIASILKIIDKPSVSKEQAKINVYFLENADATTLSQVLQGMLKDLITAHKSTRAGRKPASPDDIPVLSITPDKTTNSLIIVAPTADYENIAHVIKTLDRKRKQVFVEAMIIEASIDKLKELGTRWRVTARHDGEPIVVGGFGNINSSTIQSIITGLTGFSAGGLGNFLEIPVTTISSTGSITTQNLTSPGFAALFSLNEFKDAINVLSTPQILTSDNEEAEIVVGENVPFISKRERDITTTNTVLSSIERKDVGITLRITPQVTEGSYVKLNIYQEISAVKDTTESVLTTVGPTTTKRSTKTTVVVKDGETVVIGGLMQEKDEENTSKTPVLGDIPGLGWLFKYKSIKKNKTNLLVFLSPHVVKEDAQLSKITEEKQKDFVTKEKLYESGELLVRFSEEVTEAGALEIISGKGASVIKFYSEMNLYHIKIRPNQEVEEGISEFNSVPEVVYAEPNYKIKLQKNNSSDAKVNSAEKVPAGKIKKEDVSTESSTISAQAGITESQNKPEKVLSPDKTLPVPVNLSTDEAPPLHEEYYIQVGSWRQSENATEMFERLKIQYPGIYMVESGSFSKLRIPDIKNREQGEILLEDIREKFNLDPILVLRTN